MMDGEHLSHLPECWLSEGEFDAVCLCDRLRACEQRVEEAMDRAWTQTVALAVAHTRTATLDAAREAVDRVASDMANWSSAETKAATSAIPDLSVDHWVWAQRGMHRALAAIDALRHE